ncbi:hypothetical protein B0H21DRAFT_828220 [Amylocystis lapponica]|nr:hypothetical protein B0H21DRAFT_828220 [Amylocystis lapponica]
MTSADLEVGDASTQFAGELAAREYFWRDHQPWLEACGYMLRPRYNPSWTPSWKGTKKSYYQCEDGQVMDRGHLLDAARVSDGKVVMLKRILKSEHPHEVEISQLFSSEPLGQDSRNHCIPLLDVLQDPDDEDLIFLVLPLLRKYDYPPFDTIGEVVEFLRQIFEGIQFMHENCVAHRDCMNLNIMMDASTIFPKLYHPRIQLRTRDFSGMAKHLTRTERPTKYYVIDFGLSRKFDPADPHPTVPPALGGDRTVPEFQDRSHLDEPQNPFPTDVYYLGNMVREDFLQRYRGLEFLDALVADMVHSDPTKRPSMTEVVSRFDGIRSKLKYWKLRARLAARQEIGIVTFLKDVRHAFRTVNFIIRRYPPVPTPTL